MEKLTDAQIRQLLSYCEEREREGWYRGNKAHFEKRHKKIIEYLESLINKEKTTGWVYDGFIERFIPSQYRKTK